MSTAKSTAKSCSGRRWAGVFRQPCRRRRTVCGAAASRHLARERPSWRTRPGVRRRAVTSQFGAALGLISGIPSTSGRGCWRGQLEKRQKGLARRICSGMRQSGGRRTGLAAIAATQPAVSLAGPRRARCRGPPTPRRSSASTASWLGQLAQASTQPIRLPRPASLTAALWCCGPRFRTIAAAAMASRTWATGVPTRHGERRGRPPTIASADSRLGRLRGGRDSDTLSRRAPPGGCAGGDGRSAARLRARGRRARGVGPLNLWGRMRRCGGEVAGEEPSG